MKNKIPKILIYVSIIGLFLWELLLLFRWLPERANTFAEIASLGAFMFFYMQLNVVISAALLAVLIYKYRVKRTYSAIFFLF